MQVGQTVAQRQFKKFVGSVAQQPHNVGKPIPAYTVGKPICGDGDDVCYLDFGGAYSGDKDHNRSRDQFHHKKSSTAYSGPGAGGISSGTPYRHAGAVPPEPAGRDPSGMGTNYR
jgi:hypothetical protein